MRFLYLRNFFSPRSNYARAPPLLDSTTGWCCHRYYGTRLLLCIYAHVHDQSHTPWRNGHQTTRKYSGIWRDIQSSRITHSTESSTSLNTNLNLSEVNFPVADLAMAEKFFFCYTCWRLHVTNMPGRYLLIAFSCPLSRQLVFFQVHYFMH